MSEEHKPLTSPYFAYHSNGIWLNSSPITSLPSEKPRVKRSQDGEEEILFPHVFICLGKEVIQLMEALGPEEQTYWNNYYIRELLSLLV